MDWSADTDGNRFTLNDLINRGIEKMVADKKYSAEAKKAEVPIIATKGADVQNLTTTQ